MIFPSLLDKCKTKLNVDVNHEKTFKKLILVSKKHYIGFLDDENKEPVIKRYGGNKIRQTGIYTNSIQRNGRRY